MAKRTAEDQKTRDDADDDEQVEDPGQRNLPLAPVEGRVIRGMPKRKGLGTPAAPSPTPAAAPSSAPAVPPAASPFGGFSFGAPATTSSTPFVFGSSSSSTPAPAAAAPPANPFSGFAFGAKPAAAAAPEPVRPASTPAFSFGSTAAPPAQSPAPVTAPAPAQPAKPFAGFSFGSTSSPAPASAASNPPAAVKPAAALSFGSTSTPSTSTPAASSSSTFPAFSAPAPKPAESNAATTSASKSTPTSSQPTPPPEGEVSYYTALRGLNTSIVSFLTQTIESDPFADLAVAFPALLKQYERHLDESAKKAGWRPETNKAIVNGNGESSKTAPPTNGSAAPKLPAPPAVGGFALPKAPSTSTSSTPAPTFGGFTPTPAAGSSTSGFTFGSVRPAAPVSTPAPAAATPKKPSAEVSKMVEDVISGKDEEKKDGETAAPKPFTFGASSATPESSKKATGLFSFAPSGPLHPSTPESKTFTPSSTLESATPAKLGKFGPGGSQPQLAFGGAKTSPAAGTPGTPAAAKPFSFGFGSGAPSASTTSPATGAGFSFGASSGTAPAAPAAAPAFSFGSSSTTAPKPAATTSSFSFGSTSSASTPSFSFGAKPAEDASKSSGSSTTPASGSAFSFTPYNPKPADSTGDGDSTPTSEGDATPSKNLAETAGAGEENEDTVVEQRGKLHSLEEGKFALKGLGQFKLKRSKDGDASGKKKRRLLMRTDGNGNVILNMSVNSTFNPSVDGSHVKFLGFDQDGKPVSYALRVKNAQTASDLQKALEKEVEAIKTEA
ncbi:hypothetical protein CI109_101862 [Kwoniella shandongensis]|uniref:Uncharacterized protein n=1 Tax=Kwoniella shandongensis TaxID=1734106 RepID=A0A5M6BSN5_9TREE|nr:uncharacterized protein CI109_007060 [Kwoniella shandongensis]KAA5524625.1 hypothetical protein CI109_007060 [Kwoniella shandongensis]